jgi:hypothetical protein
MILPADRLELIRDRIARASSEAELRRTERALSAVHANETALLAAVAPDIRARRHELQRANPDGGAA